MDKKEGKKKKQEEKRKPRVDTFPKAILLLIELHAMACVTASYVLAFINHTTVVENLSITIVGQIVSPLIVYLTGSVVSNVFEKNQLSFSTPLAAIESGVIPTVTSETEEKAPVGTIDNPLDLNEMSDEELVNFEFGGESGKGDD